MTVCRGRLRWRDTLAGAPDALTGCLLVLTRGEIGATLRGELDAILRCIDMQALRKAQRPTLHSLRHGSVGRPIFVGSR